MEYLFSNGEQVDKINNKLVQLGQMINSNMEKITANELSLQLGEQMIAKDITVLDKRVNFNIKTESALVLNQKRLDLTILHSDVYICAIVNEIMGLLKIKAGLTEFGILIINTMQQQQNIKCLQIEGKFKCINFQRSNIVIKSNIVQLALYASTPSVKQSNFVSCLPDMLSRRISTLHNDHLIQIGEDFVGNNKVVKIKSLSDSKTVNAKTREILEEDLLMGNILLLPARTMLF